MNKEYYQFNPDHVYGFVKFVGAKAFPKETELVFRKCPYCQSAKDKDTFSINMQTGQFQCKRASCGAKGNMITLSQDFGFSLGNDIDAHYNLNNAAVKYKKYGKLHKYEPKTEALDYLAGRGIGYETACKYHITTYKDTNNILVFPFTDETGILISTKYRKMDFKKGVDKNKEWFEKNNMPVLFGMEQCNTKNTRLVITEGQIDSLSLAEAGIENAISVPNGCQAFTWIPNCWDFVCKFNEIVVFGDCEHDHITLVDKISDTFSRTASIKVVRVKDYKECKDANEILQKFGKEALIEAVNNAENVTKSRIISMADVEYVDLDKIEAYKTGFKKIDAALGHGIPFGTLCILTGKRGDGKSTLASQIYANAINQNYKGFMYSGELPNYVVKNWLDRQLSGMKTLNNAVINKIDNWYRDKSFMYDNTMIEDEPAEIVELIEEAVLRYGCRIFVIDNLMTAMHGASADNVFFKQGALARKLAFLTKKYNISVILVAHPKKGSAVSDIDTIAGSSDIANAADIIMTYERVEKAPDSIRAFSITKNRYNNGKTLTGERAPKVMYSQESMRIVQEDDDFNMDYGWREFTPEGLIVEDNMEDIPWGD